MNENLEKYAKVIHMSEEEATNNLIAISGDIEKLLGLEDVTIILDGGTEIPGSDGEAAGAVHVLDEDLCKEDNIHIVHSDGTLDSDRVQKGYLVTLAFRSVDLWTLFVLSHELRHIWQMENGYDKTWSLEKCEADADAFAYMVGELLYGGGILRSDEQEKRVREIERHVRRAFRRVVADGPLACNDEKYAWSTINDILQNVDDAEIRSKVIGVECYGGDALSE